MRLFELRSCLKLTMSRSSAKKCLGLEVLILLSLETKIAEANEPITQQNLHSL